MLLPKKTKYRKAQKGKKRILGIANSGCYLAFGSFGLKAIDDGQLKSNQIEAARRCITRTMKRTGKMWIRVFPQIPVTGKAIGTRMGKGKGTVEYWMAKIRPGMVLFEVDGVTDDIAMSALEKASCKLPFKTKIVKLI